MCSSDLFLRLCERGGVSGYPARSESVHDVVENSHASTALSWADGIARANRLQGLADRHVVAVIGDGALTGGMAWEALDNIAARKAGFKLVWSRSRFVRPHLTFEFIMLIRVYKRRSHDRMKVFVVAN